MKKVLSLVLAAALLLCLMQTATVSAFAESGKTAEDNYNAVRTYINTYGKYNENYDALSVDVSVQATDTQVVYFGLVNMRDCIAFAVSTVAEEEVEVVSAVSVKCYPKKDDLDIEYLIWLASDGIITDEVQGSSVKSKKSMTATTRFTTSKSTKNISSEDATDLYTTMAQSLLIYMDSVLYEDLGFGLRGLGFVNYEGNGERACVLYETAHYGEIDLRKAKEATCKEEGYTGDKYCTNCGLLIEKGHSISRLTQHSVASEWSSDCDGHWHICTFCGQGDDYTEHTYKDGVCIYCNEGAIKPSDVNADGFVDATDLVRLKKHLAGQYVTVSAGSDCNNDYYFDATDLVRLKKYLAGKNVVLGEA